MADGGAPSAGMVRHPELLSYAPALGKTAHDKATGRELGRVLDLGYDEADEEARAPVYIVLYRGGKRLYRTKDVKLADAPSHVADRIEPVSRAVAGLGSAEELEATPFFGARGFQRVDMRRLSEGQWCYSYRTTRTPTSELEVSFRDGRVSQVGLVFDGVAPLDEVQYHAIKELLETLCPGATVGDDVVDRERGLEPVAHPAPMSNVRPRCVPTYLPPRRGSSIGNKSI